MRGSPFRTKFQAWVRTYGAARLANDLGATDASFRVTRFAVYHWLRGAHEPRNARQRQIVRIAAGALTYEDIHQHFGELERTAKGRACK